MPYRVRPNCRAAACVLRLSLARRRASALKTLSYLRRLSSDDPLVFAVITEEIYVLLLSALPSPPQIIDTPAPTAGPGTLTGVQTLTGRHLGPLLKFVRGRPNLRAGTRSAFSLQCEAVAQAQAHGAGQAQRVADDGQVHAVGHGAQISAVRPVEHALEPPAEGVAQAQAGREVGVRGPAAFGVTGHHKAVHPVFDGKLVPDADHGQARHGVHLQPGPGPAHQGVAGQHRQAEGPALAAVGTLFVLAREGRAGVGGIVDEGLARVGDAQLHGPPAGQGPPQRQLPRRLGARRVGRGGKEHLVRAIEGVGTDEIRKIWLPRHRLSTSLHHHECQSKHQPYSYALFHLASWRIYR